MPDAGQYTIAILLSLFNVINFREKIFKLNVSIRFILVFIISCLVITLYCVMTNFFIKNIPVNFLFMPDKNYNIAVISCSAINLFVLWVYHSIKTSKETS
ncbi:hypothetical protein L9H26_00595 [Morganella psychrotolerans]|uniref:Uncharacterized protein n=1 Tax=Morganella psychrotolerans TaxID=368603 RepID=A0A5M9R2A0_9GAMM|nr:hypothetical protein [Morganella psychrotolerans]KAA8713495.1 hypothetical protein F4V73_16260 [Morganella psychrotolerans]